MLCLSSALSLAQSERREEKEEVGEPALVLELGGAASRSITESVSSFGPSASLEFEPIENKLEVEAGASSLFRRHATEWDTSLIFKKPWTLSDKTEFMLGGGPGWIYSRAYGEETRNSVGLEFEPEFMFWRSEKQRFGWYVEPSYEYNFASHEHSIGITIGLLIGFHNKNSN